MSHLEEQFLLMIKADKLPLPEREYKFDPKRRWRFDFAWPDKKIAVEIEGGVWVNGRHNRGKGFIADCEIKDLDDFPEEYQKPTDVFKQGRCASCRAKEILDWIDGHIELLEL